MKRFVAVALFVALVFGVLSAPMAQPLDIHGYNVIWFMGEHGVTLSERTSYYPDSSEWDIIEVCDLNGDGTADYVWRNTITGMIVPWLLNPDGSLLEAYVAGHYGEDVKLKGCADINRDGKDDLLWRYTIH